VRRFVAGAYPVLEERRLGPVPRRGLLGGRRDPLELPALDPGAVLVFEVEGQYRPPLTRRHLRGTEPDVVNAVAVSLVDVRARVVPVTLVIPTLRPGHDFVVRATFRCRVTDAAEVAQAGLTDVGSLLAEHLRQDRELFVLGGRETDLEEVVEARARIHSRLRAYCMVAPPQLPGLEVVLATVDVSHEEQGA
jgi:hypothetical protein